MCLYTVYILLHLITYNLLKVKGNWCVYVQTFLFFNNFVLAKIFVKAWLTCFSVGLRGGGERGRGKRGETGAGML